MSDQPDETSAAPAEDDDPARLRSALAQMEDRWRRAVADFDNLRKRTADEAARQRKAERAEVARRWLTVLDGLDQALEHASADPASIVSGVHAVRAQALDILTELGFPLRADINAPFDPSRHEAVAILDDPQAPPGTVVRVVRPGYGNDERSLRPASVIVAKAP
jgi:molecular chaperone GrpE